MQKLRIADAKSIAQRIGADAVVVLAFKGDVVAGASYGQTKAQCAAVGEWMDELIDHRLGECIPTPFETNQWKASG